MKSKVLILAFIFATLYPLHAANPVGIVTRHCQPYMTQPSWFARHFKGQKKPHLTKKGLAKCEADPNTVYADYRTRNLTTNAGRDLFYRNVLQNTTTVAQCNYMALSATVFTPAATDTTLNTELTTNGLARALATAAHTTGAGSSTLTYTYTYTGSTTVAILAEALFNASSGGTMCFETLFSAGPTVSQNGDTVQVTHTINHQ